MFYGGYPRQHIAGIPPAVYFSSYLDTYIERDVAGLLDVRNKSAFRTMLRLCAGNVGKLLNVASLANAADVSVPTIKSWLSILESSHIIFRLAPYHATMRKRLTKTPKLYFYDNGLLCHLLGIASLDQLMTSTFLGSVFENLIIAETAKRHLNRGERPELMFYRDESKAEVDLLDLSDPQQAKAVEIKSSRLYHDKYAHHLNVVCDEIGIPAEQRSVVARVESSYRAQTSRVVAARDWLMGRF